MKNKVLVLLILSLMTRVCSAAEEPIDFQRAQELHRKEVRGETLSADERAYLERAKEQFRQRQNGQTNRAALSKDVPKHFTPLTDLGTGIYKGQSGGLYGEGRNDPPKELQAAAERATANIRPLDKSGEPSSSGKVVLLSIGMSNTTQEFSHFRELLQDETSLSPNLVVVDGAQGGQDAKRTAQESAPYWTVIDQRLQQAGVTANQVQVVWLKQAVMGGSDIAQLKNYLEKIVAIAKKRYPNLRIIYLSSRIYGGYATTTLNPEPYAYESAFAVRDLILAHAKAETSPVLLWGPYLWADGENGRKADGLVWKREDVGPDGTHPSLMGRDKVARQLLGFFKMDANTRQWFLKPS